MSFPIKSLKVEVIFHAFTVTEALISIYHWTLIIEDQICQVFNPPLNG